MSESSPISAAGDGQFSVYYRHSGRAPIGALILAAAVGSVAAIPAAVIYAAGDIYIPSVTIRGLLCLGLALAFAYVPRAVMRAGKVRNPGATMLVVLVVAVVGYYASWIAWFELRWQRAGYQLSIERLITQPRLVWQMIEAVNGSGTWRFGDRGGSAAVSGAALWIVWGAEALLILGMSALLGWKALLRDPFCETCDRWCGKARLLGTGMMRDVAELRNQLQSGEFSAVAPLQPNEPIGLKWMAYFHHTCPGCGQLNTLTVKTVRVTKGRRGQERRVAKTVIDKMLLHPGEAEQLLQEPPAADAPAAESAK
jgi:hypothetical protein